MSAAKTVASRYRRISTLGNCVTFVIFPAAAGSALRPTAPLLSFPTDAASSAKVRGSMLRANLDSRQLDVVSLARTFTSPGAHCSDFPRLTLRRSSFRCGPWEWQGDEIHAVVEAKPTVRLGFTPGEARDKSVVKWSSAQARSRRCCRQILSVGGLCRPPR